MQLKSIEMVGFKSFADKTIIELKDGISAAVGPNGCGKSNIVDALRWCLGEMSPRSLRSKQMLDLIFSGASGRSAVNLAEVTLTFDNSHHLLPIDYSEVQITRKLFRNGESEYFLNRTQCRLKDIRDLFLDTGIGEGYSVLAQGEVDLVMNAKAEERRELFEEAAGISKYKVRREETLRKLEKVEIDLNRLNDLIAVIKEQMDSLESAAKKAKLFQKFLEELKTLEITDFLNQLNRLEEGIQTTQKRMDELQEEVRQATTRLDCEEAQLMQNRLEQDEYEKEIYQKNVSILELDKEMSVTEHALQSAQEREEESIQREKKCNERIQFYQTESVDLEEKLRKTQLETDSISARIGELKGIFEKEKEKWESHELERKELEATQNKISEFIFQSAGEINKLQNEKNSHSSLLIHKQSELVSSKKELEKSLQEEVNLHQKIEMINQTIQGLKITFSSSNKEVETLQENLSLKEKKEKELLSKNDSLRQTLIQYETQHRSLIRTFENNPYRKGTQAVLKHGFPGLRGVVGLLFKYSENTGQWVESVLGHKINFLVFDHLDEAEEALRWLKENSLGRATCIVLDKITITHLPDLNSIPNANSLVSFVHCSPELENLKMALLGSAFIAGNTLYDTGTIDGGSDLSPVSDLTVQEGLLHQNLFQMKKKLEEELNQTRENLHCLEEEITELHKEIEKIKVAVADKKAILEKMRVQIDTQNEFLTVKTEEISLCVREISLIKGKREEEEKELAELSIAIEHSQEKIDQLNKVQKEKESEREKLHEKIEQKKIEEHRSEIVAKENEVRLESFQTNLVKSQQSLDELKNRIEHYRKTFQETTAEIGDLRNKIKESQTIQNNASAKIQELQKEKMGISAQVEELLKKKEEWSEKNQDSETGLQKIREKQRELGEFLHRVEIEFRTFENEKKNIVNRMQETYQMTPEGARQQMVLKPVEIDEISKLRKKVESISHSVNLEAPEQHQQLQERYQFLIAQSQDLNQAREDLKSAIREINDRTRDQFKETFTKVRENFRAVYSTLFEGGQADLLLTDEQNLLDTGIEMVAQPPGKQLQNIALLSGGEKALTAIALLFAFFMVKPSPFCILDEVDAPLDPANVRRFLNLLKEFSQKTQILVVTHNPRTMEIADILYGVTMEEAGVSKIISAKLKKESLPQNQELVSVIRS